MISPRGSGPGRPPIIYSPASSTPNSIWGTGPSLLQLCRQYRRSVSLRLACLMLLQSQCTCWSSKWFLWGVPPHCRGIGDTHHWQTCTWRRCGRSGCRYAGWVPALYLWRTMCTYFSAWTSRGRWRWRESGSLGRSLPPCTCRTYNAPTRVLGGGAATP